MNKYLPVLIVLLGFGLVGCDNNPLQKELSLSQTEQVEKTIGETKNIEALREFYSQPFDAPGYFLVSKELNQCLDRFEFETAKMNYEILYENGNKCLTMSLSDFPEKGSYTISENHYYSNGNQRYSFLVDESEKFFDFNGHECSIELPTEYEELILSNDYFIVTTLFPDCSIDKLVVYKNTFLMKEVFFNQDSNKNWKQGFYSCNKYFDEEPEEFGGEYTTNYHGGDINCNSQNIIKQKLEADIVLACLIPTKYKLADLLNKYGFWDGDKWRDSTIPLGRLLYEQRYTNLELSLSLWEIDRKAQRYRTDGEISLLCQDYLKERVRYEDF